MDETVDSFLKEINEIVPLKNVWEECFDEKSGFTYYWNTQTDDVTWDVPEGYKKCTDHKTVTHLKKKLYIPPPSEQKLMLGSIPRVNRDSVKIYKLDDIKKSSATSIKKTSNKSTNKKKKYPRRPSSESEDEKIVLISSYGSDSFSDEDIQTKRTIESKSNNSEQNPPVKTQEQPPASIPSESKRYSPYNSEDETDLLTQIHTKAKMLKQLGGEVPESVKRLVSDTGDKKEVTSFSLVAGYGDDSDEESEADEQPPKPKTQLFPIEEAKETISPLFPSAKSVDVSQFCENGTPAKPEAPPQENIDVKAFQRKRRIGVSLVNVQKRPPPPEKQDNPKPVSERPGFGFKGGTGKEYSGFTSGGVMFAKGEEAVSTVDNDSNAVDANSVDDKLIRDIDDMHNTLDEKLKFLCEGYNSALPVQIMIIQMETLYTAMKEKCLKPAYLMKWLNNTGEDLGKLEEDAAPDGWLLQWDRRHKRYYYHNQTTGENQWQYPQPDILGVDEAMDISTTPPPAHLSDDEHLVGSMNLILPPPPPQIKEKSISPPPPPVISDYQLKETLNNGEPFPPGVDDVEVPKLKVEEFSPSPVGNDSFTSELNSFYSDIATIETVTAPKAELQTGEVSTLADITQVDSMQTAKKKKKVKMGHGLAMKKKGVSKLVEKWKNVQKSYN